MTGFWQKIRFWQSKARQLLRSHLNSDGAPERYGGMMFQWRPAAADPPRKVKVATMYFRPPGPTVEKNISMMSEFLDKAGQAGCDIVCLPEGWPTCDTGLGMTKVEANTLGGSASVMMSQKAKQYKMYIVSGLYSWVGDTLKNVAVFYDRQGRIQGVYEKIQLPDSETEQGAVPGNTFPVFTTDFGKIGILICWDSAFPEVSRMLAVNGAEILFCPIWGDVRGPESWKITARSRAIDNGVFFITNIFDGHSVIVNPAGDILQESGTQGTLLTPQLILISILRGTGSAMQAEESGKESGERIADQIYLEPLENKNRTAMINRREFIKKTGMGAAAISLAGLTDCGTSPDQTKVQEWLEEE